MKKIILAFCILIPMFLNAQNCKPAMDKIDKVSKQQSIAWESIVYESSLGYSMVNTSDWYLTIQLGRYGSQNLLTLFLSKYEESTQNATFESQFKGEKGKNYFFAFSQGESIKVTAQSATTQTKMNNTLGKLVTTISISSVLSDDLINNFKSRFDNGVLTNIEIILSNDLIFQKDIKDKKADDAKEKFLCFYDFNNKNKLPAPVENFVNNLPPNPNVPEILPRDSVSNKISFKEIISVEGATKDQLFDRAKSWMINYYKNDKFSINSKEDGRISIQGVFTKTYNTLNGSTETDKHFYSISLFVKDGKYKYEVTDITGNDGKQDTPIEDVFDLLKNYPKYTKYVNQQIYEGVQDAIKNLKIAMASDSKTKDW